MNKLKFCVSVVCRIINEKNRSRQDFISVPEHIKRPKKYNCRHVDSRRVENLVESQTWQAWLHENEKPSRSTVLQKKKIIIVYKLSFLG